MRAPNKARVRACTIHELPNVLMGYIALQPRVADDLVELTGYSISTIRQRLEALEERARIYRVAFKYPHHSGTAYMWHAGLAPDAVEGPVPDAEPIELPRRFFKTKYPAINRCDPLVAQFFGHLEARP